MSVGVVCHFFREAHTLPTFLEKAKLFFDEVVMISTPPLSAPPDDESIAVVEAAGVRLVHFNIDGGFGVVRTRCIREASTDWLCILDADEAIEIQPPTVVPVGSEDYPEVRHPKLAGQILDEGHNQKDALVRLIQKADNSGASAIRLSRRHWFSPPGDFTRPCQSWVRKPDWQLRCLKNSPFLFYTPDRKMHEHLKDSRTWSEPAWHSADESVFIDHRHFWAKEADPEGRAYALSTYEQLDKGSTDIMWTKVGFES